ncbi:MAG: hypothetical protein J6X53_09415 [Abditibacteriota bacterium]|nr:hypothetical protein [Abditibacteriota bacterium]
MKINELNRIFTEKVAAYIASGYTIHAQTMGGSQGEIAHVDLTNGAEILRVLMESEILHGGHHEPSMDTVAIRIGRVADEDAERIFRIGGTIWNNRLEPVEESRWCKVSQSWVVSIEEGRRMLKKHYARYHYHGAEVVDLPEAAKEIALPFVRRQPGCKRATAKSIQAVRKTVDKDGDVRYTVTVRGKTFRIH